MRSSKNSDDHATTSDVLLEVLTQLESDHENICCIYPTAPLLESMVLRRSFDEFYVQDIDNVSNWKLAEFKFNFLKKLT